MKLIFLVIDLLLLPFTFVTGFFFYLVRVLGENRLSICNKVLLRQGILPTRDYFNNYNTE